MNDTRSCFEAAASGFVAVVSGLAGGGAGAGVGAGAGGGAGAGVGAGGGWERAALGSWSVRDLVGHTTRALSTIETYLAQPCGEIVVRDPRDYLRAARGALVDPAAVARRGIEAGAALGPDPAAAAVAVRALAQRVTALVAAAPDDAPVATPLGGSTLLAYLPTRTFELTVHTLDLAGAVGVEPPSILAAPVAACLALAAAVAGEGPDAGDVLLALTGRRGLAPGFSII